VTQQTPDWPRVFDILEDHFRRKERAQRLGDWLHEQMEARGSRTVEDYVAVLEDAPPELFYDEVWDVRSVHDGGHSRHVYAGPRDEAERVASEIIVDADVLSVSCVKRLAGAVA